MKKALELLALELKKAKKLPVGSIKGNFKKINEIDWIEVK